MKPCQGKQPGVAPGGAVFQKWRCGEPHARQHHAEGRAPVDANEKNTQAEQTALARTNLAALQVTKTLRAGRTSQVSGQHSRRRNPRQTSTSEVSVKRFPPCPRTRVPRPPPLREPCLQQIHERGSRTAMPVLGKAIQRLQRAIRNILAEWVPRQSEPLSKNAVPNSRVRHCKADTGNVGNDEHQRRCAVKKDSTF